MHAKHLLCVVVGLCVGACDAAGAQQCSGPMCRRPPPSYGGSVPQFAASANAPLPEALREAQKAVVMVSNRGFGGGSGTYLGGGLVLTCDHLFRNPQSDEREIGRITVSFGDGQASQARLLAQDRTWDLALLQVLHPPPEAPSVRLTRKTPVKGDLVLACGYGRRGTVLANTGKVVGFAFDKGRRTSAVDTMIVSGSVRTGDSGGPMLNADGELCGVIWGSNRSTVVGTQVGRCWLFGRQWLSPPAAAGKGASDTNPPPKADSPKQDQTSCRKEIDQLRCEITLLRKSLEELQRTPGPPGPPGEDGTDGKDGQDAAVDVAQLAQAVKRRIAGSLVVRVESIKE